VAPIKEKTPRDAASFSADSYTAAMTYADAIDALHRRINYEQRGMPDNRELRLDRVARLLSLLGDPHRRYRIVHIAGTKGKGSTAAMIAALLESTGARVGLHTSPHFLRLEERFRINGALAPESAVPELFESVRPLVADLDAQLAPHQPPLTFFEITTAMMFLHFARESVEWAVVEVGLGGRLDCTNVVDPAVAAITSISLDHTKQLGNTLASIAREKAGIFKIGRPAISGATDPDASRVIRTSAASVDAPLREMGKDFDFCYDSLGAEGGDVRVRTWRREWPTLRLPLVGEHQAANCAVALAAVDALEGLTQISDADCLRNVKVDGRIEVLSQFPVVLILDTAHNEASAAALAAALPSLRPSQGPRVMVFATTRDKDWPAMLRRLIPQFDAIVWTQYEKNFRGVPVEQLTEWGASVEIPSFAEPDPAAAWKKANDLVNESRCQGAFGGLICATGSFFLAAELRELMENGLVRATGM
jgi:dihydrofolate synthase/folylpolyglutamate synthase